MFRTNKFFAEYLISFNSFKIVCHERNCWQYTTKWWWVALFCPSWSERCSWMAWRSTTWLGICKATFARILWSGMVLRLSFMLFEGNYIVSSNHDVCSRHYPLNDQLSPFSHLFGIIQFKEIPPLKWKCFNTLLWYIAFVFWAVVVGMKQRVWMKTLFREKINEINVTHSTHHNSIFCCSEIYTILFADLFSDLYLFDWFLYLTPVHLVHIHINFWNLKSLPVTTLSTVHSFEREKNLNPKIKIIRQINCLNVQMTTDKLKRNSYVLVYTCSNSFSHNIIVTVL